MKEKMNVVVAKAKNVLSNLGKLAILLAAIFVGFLLGELNERSEANQKVSTVDTKFIHKMKETSVAINERDELMIINRNDGTYEMYEDSIGKVIFRLYASQMVNKAQ